MFYCYNVHYEHVFFVFRPQNSNNTQQTTTINSRLKLFKKHSKFK